MTSPTPLDRDPKLTESLASVIDHLRTRDRDRPRSEAKPALLGSTDVFLERLVDHIAEEEDIVFPAIGAASSDTPPRVTMLKSDHAALHASARRLVIRILHGDDSIDPARILLSQLLQHIRDEDELTNWSLNLMDVRLRTRVARGVSAWRNRPRRRRRGG